MPVHFDVKVFDKKRFGKRTVGVCRVTIGDLVPGVEVRCLCCVCVCVLCVRVSRRCHDSTPAAAVVCENLVSRRCI